MFEQSEILNEMLPHAVSVFELGVKSKLGIIGLCLVVLAILVYFLFRSASERARIGSLVILIIGVATISMAMHFQETELVTPTSPEASTKEKIQVQKNTNTQSPTKVTNNSSSALETISQSSPENKQVSTTLPPEMIPEMVKIDAGSFIMGSDGGSIENRSAHEVKFAKSFSISKYEVTAAQYQIFKNSINNSFPTQDTDPNVARLPVTGVSYKDAERYAEWLSSRTGKHYRLPSEAEWEYAARGGSTSKYWWGDNVSRSKNMANCEGCAYETMGRPVNVGSYRPNSFGLYDTTGNVEEWVLDCFNHGQGYEFTPVDGSAFSGGLCQHRVTRGGSFRTMSTYATVFGRGKREVSYTGDDVGFRIVLEQN